MKHNFKKQRYHLSLIIKHLENIDLLDRTDLIVEKDTQQKSDRIPLVITYDRFLLSITKTLWKSWNILKKNLQEIIWIHWTENRRIKKCFQSLEEGRCTPCRSKTGDICCKQVKSTISFKCQQTNKTRKIFYNLNCETEYSIYLMETI